MSNTDYTTGSTVLRCTKIATIVEKLRYVLRLLDVNTKSFGEMVILSNQTFSENDGKMLGLYIHMGQIKAGRH